MRLTSDSDCWLKPVLLCNDPFRARNHKLVFCVPIKYEIEGNYLYPKLLFKTITTISNF